MIENELPRFDLPEDFLSGVLNDSLILTLYMRFPCRIKAEMFVLLKNGTVDASINLVDYHLSGNTFAIILPGSILQINKVEGEVEVYYAGFSSDFLHTITPVKSILDFSHAVKQNPVVILKEDVASLMKNYYLLGNQTQTLFKVDNRDLLRSLYTSLLQALSGFYLKRKINKVNLTPAERICQDFAQLVLDHYTKEKNVAFYASKLGITPAYLSTIVKQETGKTCMDIISNMVIMDAKAQLKSTNLPIYQIADSLNFNNVSFFGKYFKRHVAVFEWAYPNMAFDE